MAIQELFAYSTNSSCVTTTLGFISEQHKEPCLVKITLYHRMLSSQNWLDDIKLKE